MAPIILFVLFFLVEKSGFAQTAIKPSDMERIQGEWKVLSVKCSGKMVVDPATAPGLTLFFNGNNIIFRKADEKDNQTPTDDQIVTFKLNPYNEPKFIDFITQDDASKAIYQLGEGRLIICFSETDEVRPKEFTATKESKQMVVVLCRKNS